MPLPWPKILAPAVAVSLLTICAGACSHELSMAPADGGGTTEDALLLRDVSFTLPEAAAQDAAPEPGVATAHFKCPTCADFPPPGAPACSATELPAPTIAYPPDGVLMPPNTNVLEVHFLPGSNAKQFEIDFTNAVTDVSITTRCLLTPSARWEASRGCHRPVTPDAWRLIAEANRGGDPVEITVRAMKDDGSCVAVSPKGAVHVLFAQENINGAIYYWQSSGQGGDAGRTGGIFRHDFGVPGSESQPYLTSAGAGFCVGCHTLSRDGARLAYGLDDPDADDEMGDLFMSVLDVAGRKTIPAGNLGPGFQTFTHDHSRMIASTFRYDKKLFPDRNTTLAIYDGETLAFLGEHKLPPGMRATQPDLSPDDRNLAYVVPRADSIPLAGDHHFLGGSIYTSAFDTATNQIGPSTPLLEAKANETFYYPCFASSGPFLALDAVTGFSETEDAFYNRHARVVLLRTDQSSAAPIELPALNAGPLGDRLTNSWPKWSPFVQKYRGHRLLWLTFSSNRDYGLRLSNAPHDNCYPPESPDYDQPQPGSVSFVSFARCAQPQIWMSAVIIDEDPGLDAGDRSFPAFWLPIQDVTAHNHTAQWVEKLEPPPPRCLERGASSCAGSAIPCCDGYVCSAEGKCVPLVP